ncbi:MAG: ThuA domain-containing protein [Verrucomicrobiota bacterium]
MKLSTRTLLGLFIFSLGATAHSEQFSALVFSDAYDRYHHRNVPAVRETFEFLAKKNFFKLTWVERDLEFAKETYANYDVIVFVSANPCELNDRKRKEFMEYVTNGGGVMGVHAASATAKEAKRWLWWEELMGRVFVSHPPKKAGIMSVQDPEFPATMHLPPKWLWTDEWYTFHTPVPESLNVVLTVEEESYRPEEKHRMGDPHPIAWHHNPKGGRVFYTAIGHIAESYYDEAFRQHLFGGMLWATGWGK